MSTPEWPILNIQKHPAASDLYTIAIQRTETVPAPGKAYRVKGIPQALVEIIGEELVNPGRRRVMRIAIYLTGISPIEATKLNGHAIVQKVEDTHFESAKGLKDDNLIVGIQCKASWFSVLNSCRELSRLP